MAKTYVPTLRIVAQQAYNYGFRWQSRLIPHLTDDQVVCLSAWLGATLNLLTCLGAAPVEP